MAGPLAPASCRPWLPGMSLLSSYEGLRQEIQRLAQENEELRRLVQLIQENQELKLVLRNRSSSLGFCSSGFLAEVAASPRPLRRRTIKFKNAERGELYRGPKTLWSWANLLGAAGHLEQSQSPGALSGRAAGRRCQVWESDL